MKKFGQLLTFALPLILSAQSETEPSPLEESSSSAPSIVTMSGVENKQEEGAPLSHFVFLGSWNDFRRDPPPVSEEVQIRDVRLLETNPSFVGELRAEFLREPLTEETLARIKCRIAAFYNRQNQPFVVVSIPRQNSEQGVLQVVIEEAKLGEVRVKGNTYFSPSQIMKPLRVKTGESIVTKEIVEDLNWMNQNPFRSLTGFTPAPITQGLSRVCAIGSFLDSILEKRLSPMGKSPTNSPVLPIGIGSLPTLPKRGFPVLGAISSSCTGVILRRSPKKRRG